MLKNISQKVGYNELMLRCYSRSFPDNILSESWTVNVCVKVARTYHESYANKIFRYIFWKKSYAYKLYAMKCYAKKYCVKIWLKEVMCKISVHHKKCAKKIFARKLFEKEIYT